MRLFLWFFWLWCLVIASHESLTNLEAGVAVSMPTHLAVWTDDQRCTHVISLFWLPLRIANDLRTTTSAFPAGILRIDPTGDDPRLVPCLVFGVAEDATLHPEGSFLIASAAVATFFRFEMAEMFKHQNGGSLLSGELDDTMADLVRNILVTVRDFLPEVRIILLAESK